MTTAPAKQDREPARKLPHSDRSERAVLASMLASPATVARAEELLLSADFYALRHQIIFGAICALNAKGSPVDLVTLESALTDAGKLAEVGGMTYLQELFEVLPTAANLDHYAAKVRDKARRRKVALLADQLTNDAYGTGEETVDLTESAARALVELSQDLISRPYHHIRDVVTEAYTAIQSVHESKKPTIGVPTGIRDLDAITSGLQRTDMVVLAARPSVGKTALALQIAAHVGSVAEGAALLFSLEMGRVQLAIRLIASEARLDSKALRTGRFTEGTWEHISSACGSLSEHRIIIDDDRRTTLREMRAKARRVQAEHGLSLVIVDYLQLLEDRGRDRKFENRQTEVAGISRALKQMAGEFDVPVLALSQLSRKVEERCDKRPTLSDLRESGAIEQDADVVMFIHREDRYSEDEEHKGMAEIIVEKQRNGALGTAKVRFYPDTGRFVDLEEAGA